MKTKIILMLVKDSEPADLIENIKIYTGGTYAQVFHMLDYLKTKRLIEFDEGKRILTYTGLKFLEGNNLSEVSIFELDKYKYQINIEKLLNYIPSKP
ncbi:hypothetical protein bcgnr5390_52310 [Bacillus luti]|uniref:hypothetical protein n=1 Tax=Bacillus luti TaxID=2026191 RepID=UPI00289F8548|nr:hypothetical protein [Bacillus luti]